MLAGALDELNPQAPIHSERRQFKRRLEMRRCLKGRELAPKHLSQLRARPQPPEHYYRSMGIKASLLPWNNTGL